MDDRYSDSWEDISYKAKVLTGHLCSYPSCGRKAFQTHHAVYLERRGDRLVPIKSWEVAGVHVFPLCKKHHGDARNPSNSHKDAAHHPFNWIGNVPPFERRNTPAYYKLLVSGFRAKVCGLAKTI